MPSLTVSLKQECVRLWCIKIDRSTKFLLCVTFDVLELLDCVSAPEHALAPAVVCAATELSQILYVSNWL